MKHVTLNLNVIESFKFYVLIYLLLHYSHGKCIEIAYEQQVNRFELTLS